MGSIRTPQRESQPPRSQSTRRILWRIFCPLCLTPVEGLEHVGLAPLAHQLKCTRCRRRFTVTTGVRSTGGPTAECTPIFIKSPEVIDDNEPVELP